MLEKWCAGKGNDTPETIVERTSMFSSLRSPVSEGKDRIVEL
jgi:hypothetical protein